jgi:hypothetical protein
MVFEYHLEASVSRVSLAISKTNKQVNSNHSNVLNHCVLITDFEQPTAYGIKPLHRRRPQYA